MILEELKQAIQIAVTVKMSRKLNKRSEDIIRRKKLTMAQFYNLLEKKENIFAKKTTN